MTAVEAFDSAHTGSAGNGKSSRDNSRSVGVAEGLNTAPKSVRKALGVAIASGVWLQIRSRRLEKVERELVVRAGKGDITTIIILMATVMLMAPLRDIIEQCRRTLSLLVRLAWRCLAITYEHGRSFIVDDQHSVACRPLAFDKDIPILAAYCTTL